MDVADSRHAVEFLHSAIRDRPDDLHIRQSSAE